jgi:hypothetical protein
MKIFLIVSLILLIKESMNCTVEASSSSSSNLRQRSITIQEKPQLIARISNTLIKSNDTILNNEQIKKETELTCESEKDVDYFGNDFTYQYAKSFNECCEICDGNDLCNAWTFVLDIQVCWLKKNATRTIYYPGRKNTIKFNSELFKYFIFKTKNKGISGKNVKLFSNNESSLNATSKLKISKEPKEDKTSYSTYIASMMNSFFNLTTKVDNRTITSSTKSTTKVHLNESKSKIGVINSTTTTTTTKREKLLIKQLISSTPRTKSFIGPLGHPRQGECSGVLSIYFVGNELSGLYAESPTVCCMMCFQTLECRAWSYFTSFRYCFLKSAPPIQDQQRSSYLTVISGIIKTN